MKNHKRALAVSLLAVYIVIILWLTVFGRTAKPGYYGVYALFHSVGTIIESLKKSGIRSNFLGNILLFIPIGVLAPLATDKQKWYWTVLIGFCLSLLIETTQWITSLGFFDPDDVILNVLGTVMGFGIYAIVH